MILDDILSEKLNYKKPRSIASIFFVALAVYVVILFLVLYSFVFFSTLVLVSGNSMNDSLQDKNFVMINKFDHKPKINDVVVFANPDKGHNEEFDLIKRVVAVGGDKIKFEYNEDDGSVDFFRNGQKVEETYIKERMNSSGFESVEFDDVVEIDQGSLYVLGDNRNNSMDSRYFGQIDNSSVKGVMYIKLQQGSWLEGIFKLVYRQ